jgi:hypothetical protein
VWGGLKRGRIDGYRKCVFRVVFDVSRRGVISKIPKIEVKIVGSLSSSGFPR